MSNFKSFVEVRIQELKRKEDIYSDILSKDCPKEIRKAVTEKLKSVRDSLINNQMLLLNFCTDKTVQ